MNNDYGYNNKYSNKDPKKKRNGKFMEFVVKYNKIGWVLLIVLALYLGRGTLSRTINTFRNWEDIQEAKGDVILMQRLFNADRFYLEDPAEYSDVVVLENGTYSHNLRVGSDITLEQEKFEFENGDVFRHVTLPYVDTLDIMEVETLKMFTRYKYRSGSVYFYDTEKSEWSQINALRGGTQLPQNTLMYFVFDDAYYVLFDPLYTYEEVDDGVWEAMDELTLLSHTNRQGGGWDIISPYYVREGMVSQNWTLESSQPLVDLESGELLPGMDHTEKELILMGLGLGNGFRWLSDGYYASVPEGYTPYGEGYYYRSDDTEQLDLLLAAEESRTASELAFIQLYKIAQNINENGYFDVPVQDTQLYNEYGIRYGYADLGANAQIGQRLVTAAQRYGKDAFEPAIRALADFYAARLAEGTLPEYWHYKGEIQTVPASADTLKETARFLTAAGELLGESSYADLADSLM